MQNLQCNCVSIFATQTRMRALFTQNPNTPRGAWAQICDYETLHVMGLASPFLHLFSSVTFQRFKVYAASNKDAKLYARNGSHLSFAVGARAARLHSWLNDRCEEWTLTSVRFLTLPYLTYFFSEHGCVNARAHVRSKPAVARCGDPSPPRSALDLKRLRVTFMFAIVTRDSWWVGGWLMDGWLTRKFKIQDCLNSRLRFYLYRILSCTQWW